jgi:hypothetical protein
MIPVNSRRAGDARQRGQHSRLDNLSMLVFVIPILQFIHIQAIGVLSGSDIVMTAAFVILAVRGRIRVSIPICRKFLLLSCVWLLSQIVTDLVRHTPIRDCARGWSNIGLTIAFFFVMFFFFYGHPRRIVWYAWGLVAGSALTYLVTPSTFAMEEPWKFGLAYPVTLAILLVASRSDVRGHWPITLSGFAGVLNFALSFRNLGGICIAAALYIAAIRYSNKKSSANRQLRPTVMTALAVSVVLSFAGIYLAYQHAVTSGLLGEQARDKYEQQSSGKYGILLGGRVEMLSSIPAIIDSPILGHGYAAKDPKYLIMEQQALALMGYKDAGDLSPDDLQEGLIPSHSFILGAWVAGGIGGAIFWAWVWLLTCKALLRTYPQGMKLLPLAAYAAFQLLWDIPFSPYGAQMRIISPFYILILMNYLSVARTNPAKLEPNPAAMRLKTA